MHDVRARLAEHTFDRPNREHVRPTGRTFDRDAVHAEDTVRAEGLEGGIRGRPADTRAAHDSDVRTTVGLRLRQVAEVPKRTALSPSEHVYHTKGRAHGSRHPS
jgi:hypothetical protein